MQRQTDEQQTQIKQISITRSYLLKSLSSAKQSSDASSFYDQVLIIFWFQLAVQTIAEELNVQVRKWGIHIQQVPMFVKSIFSFGFVESWIIFFLFNRTQILSILFPNYYVSGDLERPKSFEKA